MHKFKNFEKPPIIYKYGDISQPGGVMLEMESM